MGQEILERNIESLLLNGAEKDYPQLAEQLRGEIVFENNFEAGVACVGDKKVLYAVKGGIQYQLDSMYNTEEMLDIWFSQLEGRNFQSKFILFGFGNGMYVRKILQSVEKTAMIIVYEPCLSILQTAIREFDLTDILRDERLHLAVKGVGKTDFKGMLGAQLEYADIQGMIQRSYLNYPKLFLLDGTFFDNSVTLNVNSLYANKNVWEWMGREYYENIMSNFLFLVKSKSLTSLAEVLPTDIPAIIVAAGPSLDKNIHELKRAKNHSLIIAVDTAVRVLLKEGIMPDLFVTIDGKKHVRHFDNEKCRDIPLICNMVANRNGLNLHTGDKMFLNSFNPHIENFLAQFGIVLPFIVSGGSVATDAFAIAERLQMKSVILVGLDLAYTDNHSHAAGTIRGEMNLDMSDEWNQLTGGVDGQMVKSSSEFMIYLDWFEQELECNKKLKVIDATEGGAKIKGTIVKSLSEAIDEECTKEVDMDDIMSKLKPLLTPEQKQVFCDYMFNLPDDLKSLHGMVKEVLRDYGKMMVMAKTGKYNSGQLRRLHQKTMKLGQEIEEIPAYYYPQTMLQGQVSALLDDIYQVKENPKDEIVASIEKALSYFKLVDNILNEMIPDVTLKMNAARESL